MIKHLAIPALMVAALCLTTTPAWSDKGHKGKDEKCDVADLVKDAKVTIDQAIKTALEAAPGTAVEAELEKKHDKAVWEVEVLGADGAIVLGRWRLGFPAARPTADPAAAGATPWTTRPTAAS